MPRFDVAIRADPGDRLNPEAAPEAPAAVLLSDIQDRPILLATTANARAFLRRRLCGATDPGDESGPRRPAPRADLGVIVRAADIVLAGSGLEADLAFLAIARDRMPASCEALTERWRAWFVRLDPAASPPTWRKTNLADLSGPIDTGCLIGPVATKDGAGRLGEALDDLFDLCRFPKELALAPAGAACAYKEMGRCPAPCDGSEPMDRYRDRIRLALDLLRQPPELRSDEDARRIGQAAAIHDFEAAARHKARAQGLDRLSRPAMREARPMDTFRHIALLGSGRPGWARAWWIDPWMCIPIADLDGARPREATRDLLEAVARRIDAQRAEPSPSRPLDPTLLGIVARHLLAAAPKRRGGFIRLTEPPDPAPVTRLIRAAARTEDPGVEEFDRATLS